MTRTSAMLLGTAFVGGFLLSPMMAAAEGTWPARVPDAPLLDQRGEITLVPYDAIQTFRALPSYGEPAWVTALVEAGQLPPVEERLPREPLVFGDAVLSDGVGTYGGVFRHVIGGRPQGWNWAAALHHGWGGVEYTVKECLTRTGPMYMLDESRVEPLPNLARSWEWSEDGYGLTMHLVEGARWSDGDPFDANDIMFHWDKIVMDPDIPSVMSASSLGEGTTLEKVDDYTIRFTFTQPRPLLMLYGMAWRNFCPGPEHILRPLLPENSGMSVQEFVEALKPENMPVVTLGAWVPTLYKPDEIIVLRRNPYYWKVDSAGNQLPYFDEMQFILSTWEDRTVRALAGTSDLALMETPSQYIEALQRSQDADFPARLAFGPRSYTWSLNLNYSTEVGVESDRDRAIRDLNRDLRFRMALSHALDRDAMAQSLVRGPFATPFAGGFAPESAWFNPDRVAYFGHDAEAARALLAEIGFADSDGNGILNWAGGPLAGQDLQITLLYTTNNEVMPALADAVISMMAEVGIEVIASPTTDDAGTALEGMAWDWTILRGYSESVAPVSGFERLAVTGPQSLYWHHYPDGGTPDLLPFEQDLADLVSQFAVAQTPADQISIMHSYNEVFTQNLYAVGLVSAPGALVVNKRVRNVRDGVPILAYQWAEDSLIREALFIDPAAEPVAEVAPGTLPQY